MERAWSKMGVCDSGVKKALSLDARSVYLNCEESQYFYGEYLLFSSELRKMYQVKQGFTR